MILDVGFGDRDRHQSVEQYLLALLSDRIDDILANGWVIISQVLGLLAFEIQFEYVPVPRAVFKRFGVFAVFHCHQPRRYTWKRREALLEAVFGCKAQTPAADGRVGFFRLLRSHGCKVGLPA